MEEYVQTFDSHVKDDLLMIANVSVEDIQVCVSALAYALLHYSTQLFL